ncbi:MAG: TetR family transcriptional regulator [Alphaproteobacteria bacterium]|nr:TetR family transcriptional regulator [Alphaproteobacteria bacterium]
MHGSAAGRKVIRKKRGQRDSNASRAAILQAALNEFSSAGYEGARVDRIAEKAGVSKPLLYDYFGDKDDLYAAALREAYVQIREAELELSLEELAPREAIHELVVFTFRHFRRHPWFIAMLNTENLRGGGTVTRLHDRHEIQSKLLLALDDVLARGKRENIFHRDISPVRLYLIIASLCYFPVSNRFTLAAIFDLDWGDEEFGQHAETVAEIVNTWLTSERAG